MDVERAEYTFCYERITHRDGSAELRRLPWAFVRFGGNGEERKYVTTLPPLALPISPNGTAVNDWQPYRQFAEIMPHRAFPFPGTNDEDSLNAGPHGVHFFGGV